MKVYITKHALFLGILEKEAELCDKNNLSMIKVTREGKRYHGSDWYENRQLAVKQAIKMQNRRIVAIEKQLEKVKSLKFL